MNKQAPAVHDLQLRHYSQDPDFAFDRTLDYSGKLKRWDKPSGFWVSVLGEDDWKTWCQAEDFRTGSLDNEHTVTLAPEARILLIDTLEGLHRFTRLYDCTPAADTRRYGWRGDRIAWDHLVNFYDGIIIAPYQWPARLANETAWYYGWDCASGCIWNLEAIRTVEPASLMFVDGTR